MSTLWVVTHFEFRALWWSVWTWIAIDADTKLVLLRQGQERARGDAADALLRCTPAMEAGLTDRLWTARDIAQLLEEPRAECAA